MSSDPKFPPMPTIIGGAIITSPKASPVDLGAIERATEEARANERARIVAWLRELAADSKDSRAEWPSRCVACGRGALHPVNRRAKVITSAADSIEAGEHVGGKA